MAEWIETLLGILLDSSLRASFIAAGIGTMLALVRSRSSTLRHAAWTAVLCAMLLMPVLPYAIQSSPAAIRVPAQVEMMIEGIAESPAVPHTVQSSPTVSAGIAEPDLASESPIADPARRSVWSLAIVVFYGGGVVVLFFRLLLGWRGMERVAQTSERLAWPGNPPIYESAIVATPMTVGIMAPRIILPSAWRAWPKGKVRGILAHEIAHIRRRDPMIRFLSRLNCCVFWFHPMAWWLKRSLSVMSEHACDDAALQLIGQRRRYAEILLDVASDVGRHRGRLTWQGIGVDGGEVLENRIDRILNKTSLPAVSRIRKVIVAASCAAVILLVAACERRASGSLEEELQALVRVYGAERENAARMNQERAKQAKREQLDRYYTGARSLTVQQVAELESNVDKSPDEFDTRMRLVAFYSLAAAKPEAIDLASIAARRKHVLWLIRFHPEHDLAGSPLARIHAGSSFPISDPEGYAEGRKLWLAHTERSDADVSIFSNAAYFLEFTDKPLAEKMLLRAEQLQPDRFWAGRFARLYASMILGATSVSPLPYDDYVNNFWVVSVSAAEAHSAYADAARQKLAASGNAELLTMVGEILIRQRDRGLDFDPVALGRQYIARAAALEPKSEAHYWMANLKSGDRQERIRQLLPKDGRYEAASKLPDRARFELFWQLALNSFSYGNSFDETQRDGALKEWDKSRKYAADLLQVADKFKGDPEYGDAIVHGNVMLGFVAAKNGDGASALKYLRAASQAPAHKTDSARWPPGPWAGLCSAIIDYGARDAVIEFLQYHGRIDSMRRDELLASAAQLRYGQMPKWYRHGHLEQAVPAQLRPSQN